ncbi:MAG: glycosyltransferase [Methylococcales bacterium]
MNKPTAIIQSETTVFTEKVSMPRVSIGMPIYNGDNYVEQTLKSLLAQSFENFELIISDNGSTDKTREICLTYAAADPRIHYQRSDQNRGASWNFNNVVDLARAEFFMWAAHDDLWDPQYIERCADILSQNSEIVICYTATQEISADGELGRKFAINPRLGSSKPHERFGASWRYPPHIPVFGLIRTDALRKTRLIGNFSSSDRVLVGHLALLGPFHGIEDFLFFYRRHKKQSTGGQYRNRQELIEWYDPKKRAKLTFPMWRLLLEHMVSIKSVSLNIKERIACYASLFRWTVRQRWYLLNNFILR